VGCFRSPHPGGWRTRPYGRRRRHSGSGDCGGGRRLADGSSRHAQFFRLDSHFRVLDTWGGASPVGEADTGVLAGQSFLKLVVPGDRARALRVLFDSHAHAEGRAAWCTLRILGKDGLARAHHVTSQALATGVRGDTEYVVCIRDASRHRQERRRPDSIERTESEKAGPSRSLPNRSVESREFPAGMAVFDGDRLVYADPAFASVFGIHRGEVLGLSWRQLFSRETVALMQTELLPELQSRGEWTGALPDRRPDGSTLWVVTGLVSVGGLVVMTGTACDEAIGEREQDAEARPQADQPRADALERDEAIALLSHELRAPLTCIAGGIDLLRESESGTSQVDRDMILSTIETGVKHLMDLVDGVLDLASLGSQGRGGLRLQPVAVEAICDDVAGLIRHAASSRRVQLDVNIESDLPVIRADPRRLRQILINLLDNAVKFTPPGGRARLNVARGRNGSTVVFEVWDTGPGLSEDDLRKLRRFAPFTRLRRQAGMAEEGTGLGLSIVHRLVMAHSGALSISSKPGMGSRFTVELPIDPGRTDARPDSEPRPGASGAVDRAATERPRAIRVLVVDDDIANLEVTSESLRRSGFEVEVARSASHALDILSGTDIDVMICDLQLPDMDGASLARRVRALPGYEDIPIVALTGAATEADRRRCLSSGMSAHLTKPVRLAVLRSTIRWLSSNGAGRPAAQILSSDGGRGRKDDSAGRQPARNEYPCLPRDTDTDGTVRKLLHDLNGALGSIVGILDQLSSGELGDEERASAVLDALTGCQDAARLVHALQRRFGQGVCAEAQQEVSRQAGSAAQA